MVLFSLFRSAYFRTLGRGTTFFGRVRFGTINGNISVGSKCLIGDNIFLSAAKGASIIIEDNVSINTGCHLISIYKIQICKNTRIGEYCSIRDQNHKFERVDIPVKDQGFYGQQIVIEEDCWIGRGVFIGPGVTLGKGCIVGANSVVTKSFDEYSIIAGNPAKVIRKRGEIISIETKND